MRRWTKTDKVTDEIPAEYTIASKDEGILHMSRFWRTLNGNPTHDGIVIPMITWEY